MQRCNGCMKEFGKEYDVCPHCGYIVDTEPEAASHLIPGTKLSDRYTVGRSIGHGGFGITYIAWDNKINKAVAVKEFFPNAFSTRTAGETKVSCYNRKAEAFHKEGVRKMLDEARRVSQFAQNENIVDIYDHFEENNTAYIVMEYLEGQDLKQYLEEKGGKVSPEKAVELIKPVLNALDDMHKENMIHRDISPDNIYLCDNGKVKLLDFGSARLAVEDGDKSLSVMVKKGYAPKEQYASRSKQGPWTDVYAVSATLYKMITGELPSESMERDEFPLKPFADFGITGYDELEKVIFKGLEVERENRTKDVKDFKTSLSAAFEKTPAKPEIKEKSAEKPSATKPETTAKSKKKKLILPLVAIALVVAIVASVIGIKSIKSKPEPETDIGSTTEATTQNQEVYHKLYESYIETPEAKKYYFEVIPAFLDYFEDYGNGYEEYESYVNSDLEKVKTLNYFDIDEDGVDECVMSVCFIVEESLPYYTFYIFDVDGETVKCVDSATELYGSHRTLHMLQIFEFEGQHYIRKLTHDSHLQSGSIYKYNGKSFDFVESYYCLHYPADSETTEWSRVFSSTYDLHDKGAPNYLSYRYDTEFFADYNLTELGESEYLELMNKYDNNELYFLPETEENSFEAVEEATYEIITQESTSYPSAVDRMLWPTVSNSSVLVGYPAYNNGTSHWGIDIWVYDENGEFEDQDGNSLSYGAPIYAAQDGEVIIAKNDSEWNNGFGNYCIIDHGNGIQTLYAHASKIDVSVGDVVKAGEQIGEIGDSGNSTGAHLHFEVREKLSDGYIERRDPLAYVSQPERY